MRRVQVLMAFVTLMSLGPEARAQDADTLTGKMAALQFLVGSWLGTGTMRVGPGAPELAEATENASVLLEGQVLMLEGVGTTGGRTVHHALGLISYDAEGDRYVMRAYRRDGRYLDAEVTVARDSLRWGLTDSRAGRIRYTMALDEQGRWHEIGEIEREGAWRPFFEMTLRRVQ